MEAMAEHEKTKRYNTVYTIATILGVIVVVLTFIWFNTYGGGYALNNLGTKFNWHPFLMVFGMIFLYSQAILVYRTGRNAPKMKLKLIHAGLHILILIVVFFGLKAVFDSHNYAVPPIANLYSMHSWLGILTVALFVIQLVVGFGSFLYPGGSKELRACLLPYHAIIGSSGFIMALVTTLMGFTEKASFSVQNYSSLPFNGIYINLIAVLTVVFGVMIVHLVNDSYYKREESSADEVPLSD